jgi:hypothetical protein
MSAEHRSSAEDLTADESFLRALNRFSANALKSFARGIITSLTK